MPKMTGRLSREGERRQLPRREEIPRMRPFAWWKFVVERCRRREPRVVGMGVKGIVAVGGGVGGGC